MDVTAGRAELVTWCRVMAVGPACAKPCDDCRRGSAVNARLPEEIRATIAAARAELGLPLVFEGETP